MDIELTAAPQGRKKRQWQEFLIRAGLTPDDRVDSTVMIWDHQTLVAAGSRQKNLLKCIAVDDACRGQGLTGTVLTQLQRDAFRNGHSHLFLYTKPENELLFSDLLFYPIAKTKDVLLMENRKDGITDFLASLPAPVTRGIIGAAVMNCNPFTKGHRYLIETASNQCDHVYVFILSEEQSSFCAADRLEMARLGTADLPNVTVLPTGPYLISAATFPTYFLKDTAQSETIQCLLDIAVFCKFYAPRFGIRRRYVGTEPLSAVTRQYNEALQQYLPENGIALCRIPRLESGGVPISASGVRNALRENRPDDASDLLPESTWDYLRAHGLS